MSKPDFKVIIAGTRDFSDYELLSEKCDTILSSKKMDCNIVIVSGTARGADRLGEQYARERGYRIERYPADWDRDGNSAGPVRNALMADNAHALIAFWDGRSRGTKNMTDTAKAKGLAVRVINYSVKRQDEVTVKENPKIQKLREQTAQYAVEHITGKGMHTGIAWFRDSFNELCEAMGADGFNPDEIGFNLEKVTDCLRQEPWMTEIAVKPVSERTWEDRQRVAQGFIRKYWPYEQKQRITVKDTNDILKVADSLSHRHLVGRKVAIDCIHKLSQEQLRQLDKILDEIASEVKMSNGLHR